MLGNEELWSWGTWTVTEASLWQVLGVYVAILSTWVTMPAVWQRERRRVSRIVRRARRRAQRVWHGLVRTLQIAARSVHNLWRRLRDRGPLDADESEALTSVTSDLDPSWGVYAPRPSESWEDLAVPSEQLHRVRKWIDYLDGDTTRLQGIVDDHQSQLTGLHAERANEQVRLADGLWYVAGGIILSELSDAWAALPLPWPVTVLFLLGIAAVATRQATGTRKDSAES